MIWFGIETYTSRAIELATLWPQMVAPTTKRIEFYIKGLAREIHMNVASPKLIIIQAAVRMAKWLTDQVVELGKLPPKGSSSSAAGDIKRK